MGSSLMGLALTAEASFRQTHDWTQSILFWICVGVVGVFGVLFPSLIFLVAILEKRRIPPLVPASEEAARHLKLPKIVEAAMTLEFRPLGVFLLDDRGKKSRLAFLLLSCDGHILLQVRPGKSYALMSRMLSGHWLVTADQLPIRDQSGLEWQEALPDAPLSMVPYYHRQRIAQAGQPCVPFSAEDAAAVLREHERQCVARLKELGLARYVGSGQDTWVFTIRGGLKLAVQMARIQQTIREDRQRVESLKRDLGMEPLKL